MQFKIIIYAINFQKMYHFILELYKKPAIQNYNYVISSKVWVFRPRFLYFLMISWRDMSRAKSN